MEDKKQKDKKQEDLKPITLSKPTSSKHRKNKFQQHQLLKGLSNTSDLEELKKIAQFKSKAGVLRTMDKLAMREEFHKALERHGLDIHSLVGKLSELANSNDEKIVLKTVKTLMKAIGVDKYDDAESKDQGWEEILLEIHKEQKDENGETIPEPQDKEVNYAVDKPEKPQEVIDAEEEEEDLGQALYE